MADHPMAEEVSIRNLRRLLFFQPAVTYGVVVS